MKAIHHTAWLDREEKSLSLDAVSHAQCAEAASASDPVCFSEPRLLNLPFNEQSRVLIGKHLQGQQVPSPPARPAGIVGAVVLLEPSLDAVGVPAIDFATLREQEVDIEAGERRCQCHHSYSGVGPARFTEARRASFQSFSASEGM